MEKIENLDLLIIGCGPAGYETAALAANAGLRVAVAEEAQAGGVCLNAGCIPTKAYAHYAALARAVALAGGSQPAANAAQEWWQEARRHCQATVASLRTGVETMLTAAGVSVLRGRARFVSPTEVAVTRLDGGQTRVEAKNVFIATGSSAAWPGVVPHGLEGVTDSSGLVETERVPSSLCVVGGGAIGLEFASIFRAFGTRVTVVELAPEVLPTFDADMARRLRQTMARAERIDFRLRTSVQSVERTGGSLRVGCLCEGMESVVEAERVLIAVGRKPNVEALGLEAAGIDYTSRGISVDENMQTSRSGVFAIGDVNGKCLLAHAAAMQSRRALNTILGKPDTMRLDVVPAVVFVHPEAAQVGLAEGECRRRGYDVRVGKAYFRANGMAVASGQTEGLVKIVADGGGRIVGAQIVGAHAADLIAELTLAVQKGLTAADVADTVHAHPTLSEAVQAAARAV